MSKREPFSPLYSVALYARAFSEVETTHELVRILEIFREKGIRLISLEEKEDSLFKKAA
ncbi:hypothetical protein AGMMS49949_03130 [Alphaproteobacteria bacterium]|nr:hypothetical protein AGMMS49949_03130 [Alphaproteobacteria bacterium]GHS97935.1 hypothetical protein AGMMS50296_5260 [Alphaproteobacteria bacterium]